MKLQTAISVVFVCILLCSMASVKAADLTVSVDASSYIRAIPETMYGTNTQCWDKSQNGGNDNVNALIAAAGSNTCAGRVARGATGFFGAICW